MSAIDAFQRLQETLLKSRQPTIKKGYKSAKEIAKETGIKLETVRSNLRRAADEEIIPREYFVCNGARTAYYKLQ